MSQKGKVGIFREDGAKFRVRVVDDESDKEWRRYTLEILAVERQSPMFYSKNAEVGETFCVDQLILGGAYSGMWTLEVEES